ncbi:MAG: hypothetical protein LUC34_05045 [Campylobacter sp.]|nr:hypothetical protein [Campylobacter sp.]
MSYDFTKFYSLSELFNDDLRVIAHIIAISAKMDAIKIYKDLEFGRYKDEYIEILEQVVSGLTQTPFKTYTGVIKAIIDPKNSVFARDDFSNIEAYSVFKRQYNKSAKAKTAKKNKKAKSSYDWGLFKGLI